MKRIISGVILAGSLIAILLFGSREIFYIFCLLFTSIGMHELFRMFEKKGRLSHKFIGIFSGFFISLIFFYNLKEIAMGIGALCALTIVLLRLALKEKIEKNSFYNTVFGIFYVSWAGNHLMLLRNYDDGNYLVLMLFLITAMGDTTALYVGKSLGKHFLAPKISPKKTIEGSVGGILGSIGGVFIAKALFFSTLSTLFCVMIGTIGSIVGQLGDLLESSIKRSLDVKDSGTIIPGHGGVLDRMDSCLLAAPAIYYYIACFGI